MTKELKEIIKTTSDKSDDDKAKGSWDSGFNVIRKMNVIVPMNLLLVCNQIASRLKGNEFSIVTRIDKKTDSEIYLSEEYYIPKQKVSSGSIEYLPDENDFNVVIHRHPDNINSFSPTDNNYINQNFQLSILYTKSEAFVNGLYNMKLSDDTILQVPINIITDYEIEEVDISNIDTSYELIPSVFGSNGFGELKPITKSDDEQAHNGFSTEDIINELSNLSYRLEQLEDVMLYYDRSCDTR